MILGNKCDMEEKRVVSKERGEAVSITLSFPPILHLITIYGHIYNDENRIVCWYKKILKIKIDIYNIRNFLIFYRNINITTIMRCDSLYRQNNDFLLLIDNTFFVCSLFTIRLYIS